MRRVWYVTRKYPPRVGGMERLAGQIVTALREEQSVVAVTWSRSQATLPLFFVWAAARILWGRARRQISVLYLGDPVLAMLAAIVHGSSIPVAVTVHGRDILYPNSIYQAYLRRWFWKRFDVYIAISRFVGHLLEQRQIPPARIDVIPLGIDVSDAPATTSQGREARPMLLALGRLVPRKGFAWFVEAVAPRVFAAHPDATLIIAGAGPESSNIAAAIARTGIAHHVQLRGGVDEDTKRELLSKCDAVIMPNVPIEGDVEGFGLVALEAGAAGKPVFATDLEGLRDAVREGENGWRLPPRDADAWTQALNSALDDRASLRAAGERAYRCVREHYAWVDVGKRYARIIGRLARS